MRVEFLIENIEKYLPQISKIIPLHSQVPVLSNLLLEANKEGFFIYSTNLETGIRVKVPAKIEEEGAICVPGKQFIETLSSLPKDKASILLEKETLKLTCRNNSVSFQTIAKEEFPSIFEEKGEEVGSFSKQELENIFSGLIFSVSLDESRPELTGVLVKQKEGEVDFVATDGFRLSVKKTKEGETSLDSGMILPSKLINEALLLKSENNVKLLIYKKANQVIFENEDVILVGRLINGIFPNYEKVIPKSTKTTLTLDHEDFSQKIKLISIFARESSNIVNIQIKEGDIILKSQSLGVGEGEAKIEGTKEGEDNEIAFNIKFLQDFLKNVSGKTVKMSLSSPIEPCLFEVGEHKDFFHVIMPVRVQD